MLLCYSHGLSEEEIAYVFGTQTLTVHAHLNSARLDLFAAAYPSSQLNETHSRYLDLLLLPQGQSLTSEDQIGLELHLLGCPSCLELRNKLPVLENIWKNKLRPAPLQTEQARIVFTQISSYRAGRINTSKHLLKK
jgi:hypothetical protein